ncbi:RmlC-like cupin [Rickenella mellea]|uniref:RmlC-like cupin n=1 Tax=Rickenella mellea TaxID=50990 RepID=A0A4Y7QCC0_9AGAM|nr:RmlC-like cupin [Rickenella mellea]
MRATSAGLVTLALISAAYAQESNADLVAKLRAAPAHTDRIALLTDNQFVFDFLNPKTGITTGSAGHTVSANSENYPAVIGNGVSMTIGFLGPCGLNTPHTHPRATEINFAVNATLRTGFLAENGARFVFNDVPAGSVTIFPQGVIHFEQNQGCEPAMFVAAFNHEDPGVDQIAQRYFGLPPDVVGATLGGLGVEEVAGLEAKIPNNVAYGTDECLKRCGLTRPDPQLTSQRQPRNDGNVLPAGFSGPLAPSSTPAKAATTPPASTATTGSKAAIKGMRGGKR